MKISKNNIYIACISIALLYFIFSLVIFSYYVAGDQIAYRSFYNGVQGLSFRDAFIFYNNSLDSTEPGYFLLVYLFSPFLDKDVLLSFVNGVFIFLVFYHCLKLKVSPAILCLLSCNYYLFVLLFSAERLKLSLLMLLLGFCFSGHGRKLLYFSVFTHVQSAIIVFILQFERFDKFFLKLKRIRLGYFNKSFLGLFFLLIFGGIFTYVMLGHITHKVTTYYSQWAGLDSILKPMVFTLLSVIYTKNKFQAFFIGSTIAVFAVLLGSERIVIFSYFVFLFYGLRFNSGVNAGVILSSIYFALKGFLFIFNVLNTGDGFISL